MRHRIKDRHFSRPYAARRALIKSLVRAVLLQNRITTTNAKAEAASSEVEKIISLAKQNTLHARRLAYDFLQDHTLVKQLFDSIAPRFKDRQGGYTRIIKLATPRKGDGAALSIVEFIDYQMKEKPVRKDDEKKTVKEAVIKEPAAHKEALKVKPAVSVKEKAKAAAGSKKKDEKKEDQKVKKEGISLKNIFKKSPDKKEE